LRKVEGAGTADIMAVQLAQFVLKSRIFPGFCIFGRKLFEGVHQRFGDEPPPEFTETTSLIGRRLERVLIVCIVNLSGHNADSRRVEAREKALHLL